jgi:hypothetical protein
MHMKKPKPSSSFTRPVNLDNYRVDAHGTLYRMGNRREKGLSGRQRKKQRRYDRQDTLNISLDTAPTA